MLSAFQHQHDMAVATAENETKNPPSFPLRHSPMLRKFKFPAYVAHWKRQFFHAIRRFDSPNPFFDNEKKKSLNYYEHDSAFGSPINGSPFFFSTRPWRIFKIGREEARFFHNLFRDVFRAGIHEIIYKMRIKCKTRVPVRHALPQNMKKKIA